MVTFRHSQSVSVAHRYWNNLWSHERNLSVYGASASPDGIGSNLRVDLEVRMDDSGRSFSFAPLIERVKSHFDHKCLFASGAPFEHRPSTLENITSFLADDLRAWPLEGARLEAVTVWELDRFGCRIVPEARPRCFRLIYSCRNLVLTLNSPVDPESGLAIQRAIVESAVNEVFAAFRNPRPGESASEWGARLGAALKEQLPHLAELAIDLGRQGRLQLALS